MTVNNTPPRPPKGWKTVTSGEVKPGDKVWTPEDNDYQEVAGEIGTRTTSWKAIIRKEGE